MTTPFLVHVEAVRDFIDLNSAGSSRVSDDLIASNIRAASWFLERATNRIFRDETALTLKFTTNGDPSVPLPGLRSTSPTVTLNGSTLTLDEGFYLIPDVQQSGVFTAIQFRPFGQNHAGPWYLSFPDWFDRNLDSPYWNRWSTLRTSLPNDLSIGVAWGYTDATLPEPARHATKVLAAYYSLRPDALLSGARATEAGVFDLSQFPIEVQSFVSDWRIGRQAVGV